MRSFMMMFTQSSWKSPWIAETEEIKFQTLALYHLYVRNIADANLYEIWLTRNRAERCKLRAVETYPVIIARMLVHGVFRGTSGA